MFTQAVWPTQYRRNRPSGEKRGLRVRAPCTMSRGCPPSAPTTYIPPISPPEKAIRDPSGENDGSPSSPSADVIRVGVSPCTGCTQMSRLSVPARSEAYAINWPSDDRAGSVLSPAVDVTRIKRWFVSGPERKIEDEAVSQTKAVAPARRTRTPMPATCRAEGRPPDERRSAGGGRDGGRHRLYRCRRQWRRFTNVRDEPIAAGGHCDDVAVIVGLFAERLAQQGNVAREPAFLHHGVPPHQSQQVILGDDVSPMLDERKQRVQDLGSERDGLTAAEQQPLAGVEQERPELE